MTLTIGETAPDFEAETTEGRIGSTTGSATRGRCCSRTRRTSPPCAPPSWATWRSIAPEFERRGVKVIGLSVDATADHEAWAQDIEETQGARPNYPIIGDADFEVSKLYGMLPADVSGDPKTRTPADNQTVRNVFVIGPDKKVKLDPRLPDDDRAQLRRGAARDRLPAADREAPGRDAGELAAGRGRDHRRLRVERRGEGGLAGSWEEPKPYIRIVPQPQ